MVFGRIGIMITAARVDEVTSAVGEGGAPAVRISEPVAAVVIQHAQAITEIHATATGGVMFGKGNGIGRAVPEGLDRWGAGKRLCVNGVTRQRLGVRAIDARVCW